MLAGEITELRLPHRPWTRTRSQRLPRPGQLLPVRRDSAWDPILGHVTVTGCRYAVRHGDTLTTDTLPRLGHAALDSYARAWLLERDTQWLARRTPLPDPPTTLMAAAAACAALNDAEVAARFEGRWAHRPVWIVTFGPADDQPTFLQAGAPRLPFATRPDGRQVVDDGIRDEDRGYYGPGVRPVPDSTDLADRGYTHEPRRSIIDAGEVVDADVLHPRWDDEADVRHADARDRHDDARRLARNVRRRV